MSQGREFRDRHEHAEQGRERRREAAIVIVVWLRWSMNVPLGTATIVVVHMAREVAMVVHGTVQDDRRFRQDAGKSGGLRNRNDHVLQQKRRNRQEHDRFGEGSETKVRPTLHLV